MQTRRGHRQRGGGGHARSTQLYIKGAALVRDHRSLAETAADKRKSTCSRGNNRWPAASPDQVQATMMVTYHCRIKPIGERALTCSRRTNTQWPRCRLPCAVGCHATSGRRRPGWAITGPAPAAASDQRRRRNPEPRHRRGGGAADRVWSVRRSGAWSVRRLRLVSPPTGSGQSTAPGPGQSADRAWSVRRPGLVSPPLRGLVSPPTGLVSLPLRARSVRRSGAGQTRSASAGAVTSRRPRRLSSRAASDAH